MRTAIPKGFGLGVISSTKEEWATVNNILILAGYKPVAVCSGDNFERYPVTIVWSNKEYGNGSHDCLLGSKTMSAKKFIENERV